MTCNAELYRRFRSRDEAYGYLASRGFLCLPGGWANGRWAATLEKVDAGYIVAIRLEAQEAA